MAHSHEKVGGRSGCSCHFKCLMVDHTTAQMSDRGSEEIIIVMWSQAAEV